jgi:hypothetical protein
MILDFYNVEDLVFKNYDIRSLLVDYSDFFSKWNFYRIIGDVSKIKQLKIDFLQKLSEKDILELKKFFNEDIFIKKLDNKIIRNISFDLENLNFNKDFDFKDFCIYRDDKKIFLTFWK